MSLPYMPGWGDTLAQHLPKIGQDIAKITNPYREEETMFKQLIATKPELMDEFAQREQDSPGALSGIFGKKVSEFVRSQPVSEQYKVARQREKSALEGSNLGNRAAQVGIDKGLLDLAEDRELAEFRRINPIANDMRKYIKTTGLPSFEAVRHVLQKDKDLMTRLDLAEPYKGQSGTKIAKDYKAGTISVDAMQGIMESNPAAMTAAFAILDDETRGALQKELHQMSADRDDAWMMKQKVTAAIQGARAMGIDNPNSYAEIVFGETLPDLPEVDEAARTQAADVFAANDASRSLKRSEAQRAADQAVWDKLQSGIIALEKEGMSSTNRSAIEGGNNGNLARLGKRFGYTFDQIPQYKRVKGAGDGWYLGDKPLGRQGPNIMSDFVNKIAAKLAEDSGEEPPPNRTQAPSDTTQTEPEDEYVEPDATGVTSRGSLGASGPKPIAIPQPSRPAARDTVGGRNNPWRKKR